MENREPGELRYEAIAALDLRFSALRSSSPEGTARIRSYAMHITKPPPFVPDRIRQIPAEGFSWIDRRILTANFLPYLTREEIALYYFLVTASDPHGISFYGFRRIGFTLGLDHEQIHHALHGLKQLDLVAYRCPFFQVLSLPARPPVTPATMARLARGKERSR